MQTQEPLDLIGLVVAIITYISTKELAETVGPYIAIIIAATCAAGWALSKEGELSGIKSVKFFLVRVGTAVIFAVTMAQLFHLVAVWASPRYTAIPIAFVIGLLKDLDEIKEYKNSIIAFFRKDKDA